jgi:hypothetical protein
MTLIAAFQPGGKYLTLMSDVLISSPEEADFVLPTRGYISPEQGRQMRMRPAALRRKVIQINPKFVILWSGDYGCAVKLAKYARKWFSNSDINKTNFIVFLSTYYEELNEKKLSAFFVWYEGFAHFGTPTLSGETKHYGKYLSAGSGAKLFAEVISDSQLPVGKLTMVEDLPDVHALNLCSVFLAREIHLNQTILSQFGAGFELLVPGPNGYQYIDDIMHIFVTKRVDDLSDTRFHPHVIRQWYEEDRLYIESMSSLDVATAGHGGILYCVPDILSEPREPSLRKSLLLRPNYVCIHHLFLDQAGGHPAVLVLKKETIDRAVTFTQTNSGFDIGFTAEYENEVRSIVDSIHSRKHP